MQTLQALAKNTLIEHSILIIYCDGPKTDTNIDTLRAIAHTREIVYEFSIGIEKIILESSSNKGLARSIVEGVSDTVRKYGKVIVLEDDIVTSPGFLKYMNEALHFYEYEESVMHISGYMYPIDGAFPETFFLRKPTWWGWGTWSRAWQKFEKDPKHLYKILEKRGQLWYFNFYGSCDYHEQLKLNWFGGLNTWAVKWYASVYLHKGLCLHPNKSLVQNIGFDATGTNCNESEYFNIKNLAKSIKIKKIKPYFNIKITKQIANFYRKSGNWNNILQKRSLKDELKRLKYYFIMTINHFK
jgi:hypothetical protein